MPVSIPVGAHADASSFKAVGDEAERFFLDIGGKVGKGFGEELAGGLESSEATIKRSAEKVARSYDRVADATGKVRTEQEKLNHLQESGGRSDRLVAQTERLESARRKESAALRQTISDLKDYEQQARQAGSASQSAFSSGFESGFGRSMVGSFMRDLREEGQSAGGMTGVLIGRSIGAGVTMGLAAASAGVAAIIGGIGYTLTKGFERLQGIDQAEFKLKALGHSGAEVSAIMKDAESSVKGTAFALNEAVGAAASAVAAGVQPGADLAGYLTTIGDAAAVANISFDESASIFNKVTTSNKAYTQELRQLADRGIPIFTWLQDAYKVTGSELDKMVKNGAIDAATFRGVIEANIGGAAKEMGQSFSGAMDNLGAAVARLGAAAIGAPFESAADAITNLTEKLDAMTAWMGANQDKVIGFWTAIGQGAVSAVGVIESSVFAITQTLSWVVNAFGDFAGAVGKANSWMLRLTGQGDKADEWSNAADKLFGLADGLNAVKDSSYGAMQGTADFFHDIGKWGDQAQEASKLTMALGGASATERSGTVVADIPEGSDAVGSLGALGISTARTEDNKQLLVPTTDEAAKILDAWRESQPKDSGTGPARPSFVPGPTSIDGDDTKGSKGSTPPPYFDPSLWSLDANPVAGTSLGPTDNSTILNARTRVEEARLRVLELEHKENVSQSSLVSAKNNVLQAERALRDAELKAATAHEKNLQRHTSTMEGIGVQLDQDFGISKGLAGVAENITRFVAGLAFAPMMGTLSAISQANPIQGGFGLAGILGAQNMAAQGIYTNVGSGYGMSGLGPAQLQPGGSNVNAMMALAQLSSGNTKYAPASDLVNGLADCSGSISDLVEMLQTGKTSPGRLFTTTDFASDEAAAKLGFLPGFQPGALNVGVTPLPGQQGHMAATLPNMVNYEGGGQTGGGAQYGGPAVGALDPQFSKHYYMPVGPSAAAYPSATSYVPSYAPTGPSYGPAPGPTPGGLGVSGMRVPGSMAPPPASALQALSAPAVIGGNAPAAGPGGPGFAGVSGLPMQAASMAASGLDLLAPGAGQAAQIGMQLANRAIGFTGQLAGIGVGGLMETFLPNQSPLADAGNSWFGRLASGFAGASPALPNQAGQQAPPMDGSQGSAQGQGQGDDRSITLNYTANHPTNEDRGGADAMRHLETMNTGPGPR